MLRALLRAIDRHLTGVAGNRQWHAEAVARFRSGKDLFYLPAPAPGGQHQGVEANGASAAAAASQAQASSSGAPAPAAAAALDRALDLARDWTALVNNIAHHKASDHAPCPLLLPCLPLSCMPFSFL